MGVASDYIKAKGNEFRKSIYLIFTLEKIFFYGTYIVELRCSATTVIRIRFMCLWVISFNQVICLDKAYLIILLVSS